MVLAGGLVLATVSWSFVERPLLARTRSNPKRPASGQLTGNALGRNFRGGPADDRYPEHRDGEQTGELRPRRDVVVPAQGASAGEHDERDW